MIKEFMLHVLKNWSLSLMELLAFFPAILTVSIFIQPHMDVLYFSFLLSLFYLFGIISGKIAILTNRNLVLILGLTTCCFAAYFMFADVFLVIPNALIYCIICFRGFKLSEASGSESFPLQIFFVSYLLHFAIIFYFSRVHELNIYLPYLAWSAFLTVTSSLLFMNFKQLKIASLSGNSDYRTPAGMRRRNIFQVLLILVLLFSASHFEELRNTVLWLWNEFITTISSIIAYLSTLFQGDPTPSPLPSAESLLPALPEALTRVVNPIWLAIMEIISTIFLLAIILAIALLLLKSLYTLLCVIVKSLFRYNKNETALAHADGIGFVDQKESLLKLSKLRENYIEKLRAIMNAFLKRELKWNDISGNIEKIRFLYRYSVVKCVAAGYRFKDYMTPTEIANDVLVERKTENLYLTEIAALYSDARYGGKDAGNDKVNEMKEKIMDQQGN